MDKSDLVWVALSTLLVLMMTVPGLALFYGGLARPRHVLSVLSQVLGTCALALLLWFIYGYSLAFTTGSGAIGGLSRLFFSGLYVPGATPSMPLQGSIPELAFAAFQATFAGITCALITGSFAERARFGAVMLFTGIWFTLAYLPIAHMVWAPDGWLLQRGALDFAGGTVVHINAGVAGLVCAWLIGPRRGYGREAMPPHNLPMNLSGAALLWVGWFGFNAGSALAINDIAILAFINTLLATAAGILSWALFERLYKGKASLLGATSGAIAGLVGITPAAGFVAPGAAVLIGLLTAIACLLGVNQLKRCLHADDAFDVFSIHGIGGISGAILTGVFNSGSLGGRGAPGLIALLTQTWRQFEGVIITILWSGLAAWIAYLIANKVMRMRSSVEDEQRGLDQADHGETAYQR
ncbi:ammonium transporter [Alcaligenaceae bacterium CGII-47]|nr:ammonium transporter [Alcaligenaceae bacterium CGII-47]